MVDHLEARLLLEGFSTLKSLRDSLRLSLPIVHYAFSHLRNQQYLEVKGMIGNDYSFVLSQSERASPEQADARGRATRGTRRFRVVPTSCSPDARARDGTGRGCGLWVVVGSDSGAAGD